MTKSKVSSEVRGTVRKRSSLSAEVRKGGSGRNRSVADEVRSERDIMIARVTAAGATDEELAGFVSAWDAGDDDGWMIPRAQLVSVSDTVLRSMLISARRENEFHTDPGVDVDPVLFADWENAGGHNMAIADVAGWVGTGDNAVARAQLVWAMEPLGDHDVRKGIIDLVNSVIPDGDD